MKRFLNVSSHGAMYFYGTYVYVTFGRSEDIVASKTLVFVGQYFSNRQVAFFQQDFTGSFVI